MAETNPAFDLTKNFLHVADGPEVTVIPVTADFWQRLQTRTDLHAGRMITAYHFSDSWDSWEVHPAGDEVVTMASGAMDLWLELPELPHGPKKGPKKVELRDQGTVIIPAGIWHTADVLEPSFGIFITRGEGTDHKPR